MKPFHKDVFWPEWLKRQVEKMSGTYSLNYSDHARKEAKRDKYGDFDLPETLTVDPSDVFEVELTNVLKVSKLMVRVSLDDRRDVIFVANPTNDGLYIRTTWINIKRDKHRTLNKENYQR